MQKTKKEEGIPQLEGYDPNNYERGSAMDGGNPSVIPGIPLVVMGEITKRKKRIPLGTKGVLTKIVSSQGDHSIEFDVLLENYGRVKGCATKFGHPKN